MFNIISHEKNINPNYIEVPSHSSQNVYHSKEQKTTNVFENVEKNESFHIVDRSIN
jgi:hypothetical protein